MDLAAQSDRLKGTKISVSILQLLLDAVLFGVIPIVYEYEGTVAQSLVEQVESVLQGRHAQ